MNAPSGIFDQGLRYLVSGGLAAVIDIGVFSAIYPQFITPLWAGATLSFLVAAVFNYTVSSYFVFRAASLSLRRALYFVVAATGGLFVNVTMTSLVAAEFGISPIAAKAVGIGTAFLLNFMINRHIVFAAATRI